MRRYTSNASVLAALPNRKRVLAVQFCALVLLYMALPFGAVASAGDEEGGVDPTPAMMTFTSTTFAPTIHVTTPPSLTSAYINSTVVPPSVTVATWPRTTLSRPYSLTVLPHTITL